MKASSGGIGPEIPFDGDFSIGYTSRLLYRRLFSICHLNGGQLEGAEINPGFDLLV